MPKKRAVLIFIISLFFLMLFFFPGCNPENKETSIEDTSEESVEIEIEEKDNTGSLKEESDQEVLTSESTEETSADKEELNNEEIVGNENVSIIKYKDIKVEIAQLYSVYSELHTSTVSLNIDKETGLIDGYILLGYIDTRVIESEQLQCESSLKGAISGSFDSDSGELTGEIMGEISGDGELCFSDEIESTLTLDLIEDGEYIEGSFKVPIYTQFDFLLQRIN